ncbi:hypothetical protein [Pseudomonas putida]|uniref:hypothetical protein n=1 Tax=Pseudomonas putida TaxID=303 RepID=UPI003CC7FE6D
MKSRIWQLAGVGLLCISSSLQVWAQDGSPLQSRPDQVRQTQSPRIGYYEDIPHRAEYEYRRQERDRRECGRWAEQQNDLRRAFNACLRKRGYL